MAIGPRHAFLQDGRIFERQDMIGNDGQRKLRYAVLLISLGLERALNRQRVAIDQAHQLGLDAFGKGEHLQPLRDIVARRLATSESTLSRALRSVDILDARFFHRRMERESREALFRAKRIPEKS